MGWTLYWGKGANRKCDYTSLAGGYDCQHWQQGIGNTKVLLMSLHIGNRNGNGESHCLSEDARNGTILVLISK